MKNSELASGVASQASLSSADADRAVSAVFSAIADALAKGETARIAGIGMFSIRTGAARQGCNPRTSESIAIAASRAPLFKAGNAIRDAVN